MLFSFKKFSKSFFASLGLAIIPYSISSPRGIFQINPPFWQGQVSTKPKELVEARPLPNLSRGPSSVSPKIPNLYFGSGMPKFLLTKESAPSQPMTLSNPLGIEETL